MYRHTIVFAAALLLSVSAASAQTANSGSTSNSGASAGVYSNSYAKNPRQAPGIGGSGLTAGVNTCLGSITAGVSGPGFGFLFGTTRADRDCQRRLNAILLANLGARTMGRKAASKAAIERLCFDRENRAALTAAGYKCAAVKRPARRTTVAASSGGGDASCQYMVAGRVVRGQDC